MNNIPTGTENDPKAPWNEHEIPVCELDGVLMEFSHYDNYGPVWECPICGELKSNEPNEE